MRLISFGVSFLVLAACCLQVSLVSCNGGKKEGDSTSQMMVKPISLVEVKDYSEFPDARLSLGKVESTKSGDSVKVSFAFDVKNYELKHQTSDSAGKLCNNSDKGQHIHFILDNKPYVALYEPKHEVTLAKNTEHYLMAFLSRSYHLSLKNQGAALVYHFKIDEQGNLKKLEDPKSPMIFYSRPKGDYLGKDTENVLLDFYVWNASLGTSHKVKAGINAGGKDTSIVIADWKPYFIQNLPMGKATITLSLLDSAGNQMTGVNTTVSRDINLSKSEPMK